jgi:hypothetical protein
MSRHVWSAFRGLPVVARGAPLGPLRDLLFDLRRWSVRYLVIDAGAWFGYRDALVCPVALKARVAEEQVLGRRPRRSRIRAEAKVAEADGTAHDVRFSSAKALVGCRLHGPDGVMGVVTDLVVEDDAWMVRELVADVRERLPAPVLLPLQAVRHIDTRERAVRLALSGTELELLYRCHMRAQESAARASAPFAPGSRH